MSAHAPGPWSQSHRKKPNGMYSTEVYDAKGETIAEVSWYPLQERNGDITTAREDNARLIAAAPDMLAILKDIRNAPDPYDGVGGWWEEIDDAIAKTTGST